MKLQGKLLLFLAGSIIALALACGWVAYSQLHQSLEEEIRRQMSTLVDQTTQLAKNRLATAKANVEIFANSALLGRYLLITDERQRFELLQAPIMRLLADYQNTYPDYYEIRVLLPDGYEDTRVTQANLQNVSEEEGDSPYFETLRNSGEAVSTTVFRNPDNGELALLVAKGIALAKRDVAKVAAEPKIRGYLAITISLSFLQDQVSNNRPGQTGYLFIIDGQGQILFHPDGTKRGQRVTPPFLRFLLSDDHKHDSAVQALGYQHLLVQTQDLFGDLRLIAVLPDTELASVSRELALSVAGVTMVAIALTTFWLFAILRSLVINPVRELSQAVRELGSGRFPKRLPIQSHDEIGELAIAFNTMSENLRQSGERIHQLAYQDILTGLPNRRLFTQYLEHFLKKGQHFALLFLDLDEFKKINDTLGHDAGDEYLREIAKRLSTCVRSADEVMQMETDSVGNTVARLGGDEFIVLLPESDSAAGAIKVAERLLETISRPMVLRKWEFHISASIGITLFPHHGRDVDSLIRSADIAMYAAKQQGKNSFQIYTDAMHALTRKRFDLETALRKALENNELAIYYQPQIDLINGRLAGVEALLRWPHPTRGMIPPDEFIPIAEQSGLITALGEWVLRHACRQAKQWQHDRNEPFLLAVNISNLQLRMSDFAVKVQGILEETGLPPQALELELTETLIMHASAVTLDNLRQLRAAGIQIALDDFGTGYSSLGALHSLPIDKLKIDRSFVHDLEQNGDITIIAAIIAMAHRLRLTVVAEGVETADQLAYLRGEGCDIAQGYLFSRPLPAAELSTEGYPLEHLHAPQKSPHRLKAYR